MMHLLREEDGRYVLDLGHIDEADATRVAEMLADLGRARRGDAWAALVTIALAREERGPDAGAVVFRIDESRGRGPTRTINWGCTIEKPAHGGKMRAKEILTVQAK